MKKLFLLAAVFFSLYIRSNAQEVSPFLFGQNHWIATGDEGTRIGYLNLNEVHYGNYFNDISPRSKESHLRVTWASARLLQF